mmetsp:Transcript_11825/g.29864  ORF Transcript_11825/g.29864 Transcript_11825/m.29864 type:complete len:317 (+) Transcript_11825:93-1043(+)
MSIIRVCEEGCGRCRSILARDASPEGVYHIFASMLDQLGHGFLENTLTAAIASQSDPGSGLSSSPFAASPATSPSHPLQLLNIVHQASNVMSLVLQHFLGVVMPAVSASINERAHCTMALEKLQASLESRISTLLSHALSSTMLHTSSLLKQQGKADFKVRDHKKDGPSDGVAMPTSTCSGVVEYLSSVSRAISVCLDGQNLENALGQLGTSLYLTLLKHFKSLSVSQGLGGMQLMRDVSEYQSWARSLGTLSLHTKFDLLRHIANMHTFPPHNLQALIEETSLSKLSGVSLLELLRMRTDFKPSWLGTIIFIDRK